MVIALPTLSFLVGATFLTNDDAAMSALADGSYTGEPTHQVPFVSRSIGLLLRSAYEITDSVQWYSLLMSASCGVGLVLLLDAVRRVSVDSSPTARRVATLPLLFSLPYLVWNVSFTLAAFVLCGGALIHLSALAATDQDVFVTTGSRRLPAVDFGPVVLGVLFGLGAAIRSNAAIGVVVVTLPLLLVVALRFRRASRYAAWGALGFASVVIVEVAARALVARSNPEFNDWLQFNQLRGGLHGTSRVRGGLGPEELAMVGWSPSDKFLFATFTYDDPAVFGPDVIASVDQVVGSGSSRTGPWKAFRTALENTPTAWQLVLIGLTLIGRSSRRFVVLMWLWWGVIVAGLGWFLRAPQRVTVPIVIITALTALVGSAIASRPARSDEQRRERLDSRPHVGQVRSSARPLANATFASAVLLAVLMLPRLGVADVRRASSDRTDVYGVQLEMLGQFPSTTRFVGSGGAILGDGAKAFGSPSELVSDRVLLMGWPTFSPAYEARKARLGISDTFGDLARDDDIVFVVRRSGTVSALTNYYERHRGEEVSFEPVSSDRPSMFYDVSYETDD